MTAMTTKDIAVNGQVFPCPLSWTVEQAEGRIRSGYGLQNGFIIEEDGVPVLGTALIRDLAGTLAFVRGATGGDSSADIPAYGEEPDVRICQCAVELFNTGYLNAIRPTSLTLKMGFCSQAGLFGGSSGAAYVIADYRHKGCGKAFGMHCESIITARTIGEVEHEGIILMLSSKK